MTTSAPEPASGHDDDHPGTAPDEGRVEAEEMDGDSDGGDTRQRD